MTELPVSGDFVHVLNERELARLLGYPRDRGPSDAVAERVAAAQRIFASRARPRVFLRECSGGIAAAITAGHEIERVVKDLWREDRVDEAYVLDRVAAAVVEELARETRARLVHSGVPVLPHRSPGYDGWPLEEQEKLYELFAPLDAIRILPSGMLAPVASLLALYRYGLETETSERECARCSFRPCRFRRAA